MIAPVTTQQRIPRLTPTNALNFVRMVSEHLRGEDKTEFERLWSELQEQVRACDPACPQDAVALGEKQAETIVTFERMLKAANVESPQTVAGDLIHAIEMNNRPQGHQVDGPPGQWMR